MRKPSTSSLFSLFRFPFHHLLEKAEDELEHVEKEMVGEMVLA
jgi:hypothetical protein